jgi:hypothetical protein
LREAGERYRQHCCADAPRRASRVSVTMTSHDLLQIMR